MHIYNWSIPKNTFPKPRESETPHLNQKPVILTGFAPVRMRNNSLTRLVFVGVQRDAIED